jgi:hypothetical protein
MTISRDLIRYIAEILFKVGYSSKREPENEYRTQSEIVTANHAFRTWLTRYSSHNRPFCQFGASIGFTVTESSPDFSDFLQKHAVQRWDTQFGRAN